METPYLAVFCVNAISKKNYIPLNIENTQRLYFFLQLLNDVIFFVLWVHNFSILSLFLKLKIVQVLWQVVIDTFTLEWIGSVLPQ